MHLLLRSLTVFLFALLLWVFGLGFLYTATKHTKDGNPKWTAVGLGLEDAVSSFFSGGTPTHHAPAEDLRLSTNPPTATGFLLTTTNDFSRARSNADLYPIAAGIQNLDTNVVAIRLELHALKSEVGTVQTNLAAIQKDMNLELEYVLVICLATLAGFLHLGIFISHIYTIVNRK